MTSLAQLYSIRDANLAYRKQFIRFTSEDMQILSQLKDWAKKVVKELVREFYDHQFSVSAVRRFFEEYSRRKKYPFDRLRARLESMQALYFVEIFDEAAKGNGFDEDYFEKRLKVGKLHNDINLPLKWFVGSYVYYFDLVRKYLNRAYPTQADFCAKAERAILAVFNYDTQAIMDAFFFDSTGIDLSLIPVANDHEDLSDNYAGFKQVLNDTITGMSQVSSALVTTSEQLTYASAQSSQATQQIASTIGHVAQGSAEQARSVEEVRQIVLEQNQSVADIARGAQRQLKAAQDARQTLESRLAANITNVQHASDGSLTAMKSAIQTTETAAQAVTQTIVGMRSLAQSTKQVGERVTEMGRLGKDIGVIVRKIDAISERTNLLALNAAIEAARAGEHGRGFAVVADEVRKLAEQAARSTQEITEMVSAVQSTAAGTVKAMEQSSREMESGVTLAAEAEGALGEIRQMMHTVSNRLNGLANSVVEMTGSSEDMRHAMEEVSMIASTNQASAQGLSSRSELVLREVEGMAALSEENSAAAEEVAAGAEEVTAQVEQTTVSTAQLREMAEDLSQIVQRFEIAKELQTNQLTSPVPAPAPAPVALPTVSRLASPGASPGASRVASPAALPAKQRIAPTPAGTWASPRQVDLNPVPTYASLTPAPAASAKPGNGYKPANRRGCPVDHG